MALYVVFGDGPQSTIHQRPRSRPEKPPDIPIIQSDDYRVRTQHGNAYIDPDKMPRKPTARSKIKIEEVLPDEEAENGSFHRDKRIKQEGEDEDEAYGRAPPPGGRLAIEAKPENYGDFNFSGSDSLFAGSPRAHHSDDDDDDDEDDDDEDDEPSSESSSGDDEGTEIVDQSEAAMAFQKYADPVPPRTPPRQPWHASSHSTHYDRGRDRAPSSPRASYSSSEFEMPYHQPPPDRGGLFGDGVEYDHGAPRAGAAHSSAAVNDDDAQFEFAEDPRWCPACDAALRDLSKRCSRHGARLLPRPVPRSDPWKMATGLHGGICSPSLCVLCTDLDITVGRPIETEVNNMIIKTPEVLKLAGIAAAALFLANSWQETCNKYQTLIPAHKRNLYLQMNGPSILWHLAEHASIAEIFLPIDAIELRAYSRRVRDNDVPGGVGVDENSVSEATGLSHEGLRKLKLIEGISRQTRVTMPNRTNFTYNRVPQPSGSNFTEQVRRLRVGGHLQ